MAEKASAAGRSPDGPGAGRRWLLPAGTFLGGLALGGVLVGAVVGDGGAPPPAATTAAEQERSDQTGDQSSDSRGTGLYVRVPDACVQTADDATALVEQVDRVVAAVAGLEPERLRQTVDEVQQVRDEVAAVAQQCRQQAELQLQDAASAEPTPAE